MIEIASKIGTWTINWPAVKRRAIYYSIFAFVRFALEKRFDFGTEACLKDATIARLRTTNPDEPVYFEFPGVEEVTNRCEVLVPNMPNTSVPVDRTERMDMYTDGSRWVLP